MRRSIWLKPLIILLTAGMGIFLSCQKGKSSLQGDATLINTGSIALDGCDWIVKTNDGNMYHAENLNKSYMVDSLKVHIVYNLLNSRFQCGIIASNGFPVIHINTISKK